VVGLDEISLETSSHDPFTLRTDIQHVVIRDRTL